MTEQHDTAPVELTPNDSNSASNVDESSLVARIAELEQALADGHKAVADHQDVVLRTRAEMENVRRRSAQDVEKAQKFALEKFANELLSVVDNLERALSLVDANNEGLKAMAEGLELTLRGFLTSLAKFGVEVVDPVGQPFNPELHQAMSMVEHAELPANSVLLVMQKGYTLNGRLLRPAMVAVTRVPEAGVDTSA